MIRNYLLRSLFSRLRRSGRFGSGSGVQARGRRRAALGVESLETRAMLTTLTVDIGDPTADAPGDNLYAEIQEAVDAAAPGDKIRVHEGTY